MAFVATKFELVVTMIDRGSNKTTRTYPMDAATDTYAEAIAQKDILLPLLIAVTDLAITGFSVNQRFEEDALSIPTGAGAEVSSHAEISGLLDGFASKRATLDIPGPQDSIFVGATGKNYNIVDTTSGSDAVAFAALFGTTGHFTISDGEKYAAVADFVGKRTHSASRTG